MKGSHRLAVQHGTRGYFGLATLEVQFAPAGMRVDSDVTCQWQTGILFGVAYAFEKMRAARREVTGVHVRVIEFEGHAVDTTEVVAAFVTAQAFFDAVRGSSPPELRFDPTTGLFTFPK